MSELKAAFAERTKRSLKKKYINFTWKIMDTSAFTKCFSLSQSWIPKKYSIDLIPKNYKNSDFLSILYTSHCENKKTQL